MNYGNRFLKRFGSLAILVCFLELTTTGVAKSATLNVPNTFSTIQSAIDAADSGDVVRVAPGTYNENLVLQAKTITLTSHFGDNQDESFIAQTVIDGGGGKVITVHSTVGEATTIQGFTIRNGDDGVLAFGRFQFLHNQVTDNIDGIDYGTGGGGVVRNCVFDHNGDDAIDFDGASAAVIEDNQIINNGDDGIEVRLHDYIGPELEIVIRGNVISGNGEDGIQLIDDENLSSRVFLIERNLIMNNAFAGVGMMCCQNTIEDFQGASIPERILLFNNTFVGNDHGVTGGDNLIALNNLFVNTTAIALKNVDGGSIASFSLFFGNGTDVSGSNVDFGTSLFEDPGLDASQVITAGSPAVDAGIAFFEWQGEVVLDLSSNEFLGSAPDLGYVEIGGGGGGGTGNTDVIDVPIVASSDNAEELATGSMYLGSSDLELVRSGGGNQTVGLRFTGVAIPQGATISTATVQFQVDEPSTGATTLMIEGEATDSAVTFGGQPGNISSRSRTSAAVGWTPAPWPTVGERGAAQQTPNLATIFRELVNRGGWASGNSVVLIFTGTGERVAESFTGDPTGAPVLHLEYTSTVTIETRVLASSDDAEQQPSGTMIIASNDLDMVRTSVDQIIGMRFNVVTVPAQATITNAYIQFQADEVQTGSLSLTVEGEAADDAPTFVTVSGNITDRPRTTAAVTWSPAPWTTVGEAGVAQRTPNIATVIQEIVDRTDPGWASGNSLVLIITGSDPEKRAAEAFDSAPNGAPLLHVEYTTP